MSKKEELNYKEAYAHLFHGVSMVMKMQIAIVRKLMYLQRQAEEICISEASDGSDIDSEEVLKVLVALIKQNLQEE